MYTEKDHTWVVCAYKESQFLEQAIHSILQQSKVSNILIATSTPNEYISTIADKYKIPLYVNKGEKGIANDWQFAYNCATTKLVTLCHQDDLYSHSYTENVLQQLNKKGQTLIVCTNYAEKRGENIVTNSTLLRVKRILITPLRFSVFQKSKWIRRRCLSLGNCICCPSVTYVKENLPKRIFTENFKSNVDWETWERLSKQNGLFVYIPKILMLHRIHEESTTTEIIEDSLRTVEDYEMFCKFWPKRIAKRIRKIYQSSEKSNEVK